MLDDPTQMADPKAAFTNNPYVECEVHLTFTGQGRASMFGGEPDKPHEAAGEEFAKGHYEQLVAGTGTIRVGDEEWVVDGFGLRDHSWGPRYWQAPWYYRWLTANVGADFGFMASRVARRDGPGTRGGFVWEDGRAPPLRRRRRSRPSCVGDDRYHQAIRGTLLVEPQQPHVGVHRRGAEPHPAAQPPQSIRTATSSSPASARASPAGPPPTAGWATGCRSTSTRSSTARPVGLAE